MSLNMEVIASKRLKNALKMLRPIFWTCLGLSCPTFTPAFFGNMYFFRRVLGVTWETRSFLAWHDLPECQVLEIPLLFIFFLGLGDVYHNSHFAVDCGETHVLGAVASGLKLKHRRSARSSPVNCGLEGLCLDFYQKAGCWSPFSLEPE